MWLHPLLPNATGTVFLLTPAGAVYSSIFYVGIFNHFVHMTSNPVQLLFILKEIKFVNYCFNDEAN